MQSKPSNPYNVEAGINFSAEAFLHLELDFSTFRVWFLEFLTVCHKKAVTVNFPVSALEKGD